jgi:phage FluMu gp28-like protein
MALAKDFDTDERVKRWGTDAIKRQYANMDLASFQQEYECSFADESVNFYPWSLVVGNVDEALDKNVYEPELNYHLGIDIAKKVDKTVVTVSSTDEEGHLTIHRTFETQSDYEQQVIEMDELIHKIKPTRVTVDATGVGAVIAERLVAKHGGIIEPVVFTNARKETWATSFKRDLQLHNVSYPRKRELLNEIHSIERKKTEAGNYTFKAREGQHDDYFWSAMLSLYGEGRTAPSIGYAW